MSIHLPQGVPAATRESHIKRYAPFPYNLSTCE
jgi:hypothetical protein